MRTLTPVLFPVVAVFFAACGVGPETTDRTGRDLNSIVPPPFSCEQLPVDRCDSRPDCEVVAPACAACLDDGTGICPPCSRGQCVTKATPQPPSCEQTDVSVCASRPECEVVAPACAACLDDGSGACPPCRGAQCVTRVAPPKTCETLTERAACELRPDCTPVDFVCTAECVDDGNGRCKPCEAFRCVELKGCEQLEPAQCTTRNDCVLVTHDPISPNDQIGLRCLARSVADCKEVSVEKCESYAECKLVTYDPNTPNGQIGVTCSAR